MKTVHEAAETAGVSIRTLRYYDSIGLLNPASTTEAGYRLYDEACMERLRRILLYRELDFSLKEIGLILDSPDPDCDRALEQQIGLLRMRKERLEKLISMAERMKKGERNMSFEAFDRKKIDRYAEEAKKTWGQTEAYREYEKNTADYTRDKHELLAEQMMNIFREIGDVKNGSPDSAEARALIRKLQTFITENYYNCTDEILSGLGQMYAAGGEMTENIDTAGGKGTAAFTAAVIEKMDD